MTIHELHRETRLSRAREEVFTFFAQPSNLERITPHWLRFRIDTPQPVPMQEGARIDYRLRLRGLPLRWQSEITVWEPPWRFVDEQRRGPFRCWVHEHRFEPDRDGTRVIDEVRYSVFGGSLVHRLLVERQVHDIFVYRAQRLHELFGRSRPAPLTYPPRLEVTA